MSHKTIYFTGFHYTSQKHHSRAFSIGSHFQNIFENTETKWVKKMRLRPSYFRKLSCLYHRYCRSIWSAWEMYHKAPGRYVSKFKNIISENMLRIKFMKPFCESNFDDRSTLVQAMARYRQASSHYLHQCWRRTMRPNGVTRSQRIKWDAAGILF